LKRIFLRVRHSIASLPLRDGYRGALFVVKAPSAIVSLSSHIRVMCWPPTGLTRREQPRR
jgi:hypothetical protein